MTPSAWALGISAAALLVSVANVAYTWWHGRVRLAIRIDPKVARLAALAHVPLLLVEVDNPSRVRIQVRSVGLTAKGKDFFGIESFREDPLRIVDFVEPEASITYLWNQDDIRRRLRGAGIGDRTKVRVVCRDALGRRHLSKKLRIASRDAEPTSTGPMLPP